MERIAFIYGETFVYWSSIILTLATVCAICTFVALYLPKSRNIRACAEVIPFSIVVSLILARLVHWYCRTDSYSSFLSAITSFSGGGFALMGVFAGCLFAACFLRAMDTSENLPEMLDCMCIAGAAGIAVGRLSALFNTSGRGQIIESVKSLPWVYPVTNAVSGVSEYRLATFMLQAMVTAVIFVALLVFYLRGQKKGDLKDGDTTLLFLLCYGASQVVLDSTRYDSLFFRSNGFVSIVQVLAAFGIGIPTILLSIRLVRQRGWKYWYLGLWTLWAGLMGLGGYMEYHVQRHGDQAVFAYSVMSAALIVLVALGCAIWYLAEKAPEFQKAPAKAKKVQEPQEAPMEISEEIPELQPESETAPIQLQQPEEESEEEMDLQHFLEELGIEDL